MSSPDAMGLTPEAARAYEREFVPAIFAQWPPVLLAAARIGAGDHVLEVGCGTGVLARRLRAQVGPSGRVVGLDLSDSMLSVARERCPEVELRQGDAMALPFPDASFDAALGAFMLMFVPDPELAVRELWRVLRPGGRLVVSVWEGLAQNPAYATLAAIATRRLGQRAGDALAWPFALGADGKLAAILAAAAIPGATIRVHAGRARFPSIARFVQTEIQAWILADQVEAAGVAAVVAEAEQAFSAHRQADGSVELPLNALVASATRV